MTDLVIEQNNIPGTGKLETILLGTPPPGSRWYLKSAKVVTDAKVVKGNHAFLFTQRMPIPGETGAGDGDFLAHGPAVGKTITGIGGYTEWMKCQSFVKWNAPLHTNSAIGVKFEYLLDPGDFTSYELVYELIPEGIAKILSRFKLTGNGTLETLDLGTPDPGTYWYVEKAECNVSTGSETLDRISEAVDENFILSQVKSFPLNTGNNNSTGGYSSQGTAPRGRTNWLAPVYVLPGQHVTYRYKIAPGDISDYVVIASILNGVPT